MKVLVHPRVIRKRPWFNETEVINMWNSSCRELPRQGEYELFPLLLTMRIFELPRQGEYEPSQMLSLAWDSRGVITELIAYKGEDGEWIIFHVVPATKKFLAEMGFSQEEIRQIFGRR